MTPLPPARHILTAEVLSIGTEITVGETRDTNAGELARALVGLGVQVTRLVALPDELPVVREAIAAALERADLVVSTGGLGPTPDDLTREAIAAVAGETPSVDGELERWLRELWARRRMAFPEANLKQAWLIPSASALENYQGTAPGWWVDRPDGRIVVAMPGPPREMRPMWHDRVLPRLHARGIGREQVVRTFRLAGVGESQAADLLGEVLLRARNPVVATYARADAVDVRISAVAEPAADGRAGRTAEELADEAERSVLAVLGRYVWGHGNVSWPAAIEAELDALDWRLAFVEVGTHGSLTTLLGELERVVAAESLAADGRGDAADGVEAMAEDVRRRHGSDVGLAVRAAPRGQDTSVAISVATAAGTHRQVGLAFLGGPQGRSRAALSAATMLLQRLREARARGTAEIGDDAGTAGHEAAAAAGSRGAKTA